MAVAVAVAVAVPVRAPRGALWPRALFANPVNLGVGSRNKLKRRGDIFIIPMKLYGIIVLNEGDGFKMCILEQS